MVGCYQKNHKFHEKMKVTDLHRNLTVRIQTDISRKDCFLLEIKQNPLKILPIMDSNETGLLLSTNYLFSFLSTKTTLDVFNTSGKISASIQFLNIIDYWLPHRLFTSFLLIFNHDNKPCSD